MNLAAFEHCGGEGVAGGEPENPPVGKGKLLLLFPSIAALALGATMWVAAGVGVGATPNAAMSARTATT
jgi:hypothetical protein